MPYGRQRYQPGSHPNKVTVPVGGREIARLSGGWILYERLPPPGATLWANFKLYREGQRKRWGKRNVYWFAWGWEAQRFARSADLRHLTENQPSLLAEMVPVLKSRFPPDFLERPDLLVLPYNDDTAELQAYRDRVTANREKQRATTPTLAALLE